MHTRSDRSTETRERSTMQAVTQRAWGSTEVPEVATIERPTVADDEVLLEVEAAGLDRGVWHLMTGRPYLMRIMGSASPSPGPRCRAWTSPAASSDRSLALTPRSISAMVNAETYWSPTGTDVAHTSTGRLRPRTRSADTTLVSRRYFTVVLSEPSGPGALVRTRCWHLRRCPGGQRS